MSNGGKIPVKPAEELVSRSEPFIAEAMVASFQDVVDGIDLTALTAAIASRDIDAALELLDLEDGAFTPLRTELTTVFETAGQLTAKTMPKPDRDMVNG